MSSIREVLLLVVCSMVYAQRQTITNARKCTYSFLTESAICGNSNYMRDVSKEFRDGWKHIKVMAFTGTFSLAGMKCWHTIHMNDLHSKIMT